MSNLWAQPYLNRLPEKRSSLVDKNIYKKPTGSFYEPVHSTKYEPVHSLRFILRTGSFYKIRTSSLSPVHSTNRFILKNTNRFILSYVLDLGPSIDDSLQFLLHNSHTCSNSEEYLETFVHFLKVDFFADGWNTLNNWFEKVKTKRKRVEIVLREREVRERGLRERVERERERVERGGWEREGWNKEGWERKLLKWNIEASKITEILTKVEFSSSLSYDESLGLNSHVMKLI